MQYIGIDMSKDSFMAAFDKQQIQSFTNDPAGISEFLSQVKDKHTQIGIESTGVYHLLLASTAKTAGFTVKIINPLISHRMIQTSIRQIKTDKTDAVSIRKALLTGAGYPFTDTKDSLMLKTLISQRQALAKTRSQLKQKSHTYDLIEQVCGDSLPRPELTVEALNCEVKQLEKRMKDYAEDKQKLLQSIPGVGPVTSAALVAYITDINRFASPEKLVAYIGLDCRVYESGTSVNKQRFITKRGNKYLRHILFNAAFAARQKIPELKAFFDKKLSEGKHYFTASVAVERKLVHLIYAVWKRQTPYEERLST